MFVHDQTFESDLATGAAPAVVGGLLGISVQPFMQRRDTNSMQDASSESPPNSGVLHRFTKALTSAKSAAVQAAKGGDQPWYILSSKVAADFAHGHEAQLGDGTSKAPTLSDRPRIYHVRRSLQHLHWFRDVISDYLPYFVTRPPLPRQKDAHSREGVDEIIALLHICASCPQLRDDPFFWSLITQDDAEFHRQFEQLNSKSAATSLSESDGERTGAVTSARPKALKDKVVAAIQSRNPFLNLPTRDLKPPRISDMLMETGVVDRAMMTLDKVNTCVGTSFYFEERISSSKASSEAVTAWMAAGEDAYALHDALEAEREALLEVGDALRELAFPSLWPWSREAVMDEADAREERQSITGQSSSRVNAEAETSTASSAALRPAPSQRLIHYMHRMSNVCRELGRLEMGIYGDAFCAAVQTCRCVRRAVMTSADAAHLRLHGSHPPRRGNPPMTLPLIQKTLLQLMSEGTGHDALDTLEKLDANISGIQETIDDAVSQFEGHAEQARRVSYGRLMQELRSTSVGEMYAWQGALLLLADMKTTLELDTFLDDEPLPINSSPVVHNPSPQQARRFEALQEEWGSQLRRFFSASESSQESKPTGKGRRRTALRDLDVDQAADAFDEPYEMHSAQPLQEERSQSAQFAAPGGSTNISVLPPELQEVIDRQQKSASLLLERSLNDDSSVVTGVLTTEESPHREFSDTKAKAGSKNRWKQHASPKLRAPGAPSSAWGNVAEEDESDPFAFDV